MATLLSTGVRIPIGKTDSYVCLGSVETTVSIPAWMKYNEGPRHTNFLEQTLFSALLKRKFEEGKAVVVDVIDFSWGNELHEMNKDIADLGVIRASSKVEVPVWALVTLLYRPSQTNDKIILEGSISQNGLDSHRMVRAKFDEAHFFQVLLRPVKGSQISESSDAAERTVSAEFIDRLGIFKEMEKATSIRSENQTDLPYYAHCANCSARIPVLQSPCDDSPPSTLCDTKKKHHVAFLTLDDVKRHKKAQWAKVVEHGRTRVYLRCLQYADDSL
ncbi:molybdopterin biosynthesis protein [Perkinsela sp. CCAP 1560/4]|nr:molybdopterin biosynthesis protein [Perkinsela sp. CCAP 1560/4]|eukprot:KNH07516.1 molybdopterin biosynthesis protein [Perkinsela sp. CCAP 1560/4]